MNNCEGVFSVDPGDILSFEYENHRNETKRRTVQFLKLELGLNEWYPEKQWFIRCIDLDREAEYTERSFALAKINLASLRFAA